MKARLLLTSLTLVTVLAACGTRSMPKETVPVPEPIPEGATVFDYSSHLYFDAWVNDSVPACLVFDTGATGLYVDSLWLVRSAIAPQRLVRGNIGGAGVGRSTVDVVLDTLHFRIGDKQGTSAMTPVLQLKEILGRRADGIFGQVFLAEKCVEINLRRGYMREVSADTLASAGFVRHAVRKQAHRIYIEGRVQFDAEHVVDGWFVLDMGSPSALTLSTPAAAKAGFETFSGKKVAYRTVSGGIGGASESILSRADLVTFCGHTFARIPVWVSKNRSGFLSNEHVAGLIGNKLLERFDLVIDFTDPAIWLRPAPGFDSNFSSVSIGFATIDRTDICQGWPVMGVYEQPYAPAGLEPGDVVVTWDGVPVVDLDKGSIGRGPGMHRIEAVRDGVRTDYEFEIKEIL